jgi:hypothetical protein
MFLMFGGAMMFHHQCGEGTLQYHSLVVTVDCHIMLKLVMEENKRRRSKTGAKGALCCCHGVIALCLHDNCVVQ